MNRHCIRKAFLLEKLLNKLSPEDCTTQAFCLFMKEGLNLSTSGIESLHKKALKSSKKSVTSSKFWSDEATRNVLDNNFKKDVSVEKERIAETVKFLARRHFIVLAKRSVCLFRNENLFSIITASELQSEAADLLWSQLGRWCPHFKLWIN